MDHLNSEQNGDVIANAVDLPLISAPSARQGDFPGAASPQAEQYNQIMSFSRPLVFFSFSPPTVILS